MRAMFSLLGLLVVLGVIGLLAKKQLHSTAAIQVPTSVAGQAGPIAGVNKDANVQQQSQQLQEQFKAATEAAMQPARAALDENK